MACHYRQNPRDAQQVVTKHATKMSWKRLEENSLKRVLGLKWKSTGNDLGKAGSREFPLIFSRVTRTDEEHLPATGAAWSEDFSPLSERWKGGLSHFT